MDEDEKASVPKNQTKPILRELNWGKIDQQSGTRF